MIKKLSSAIPWVLLISALSACVMITTARPLPWLCWAVLLLLSLAVFFRHRAGIRRVGELLSQGKYWLAGGFLSMTLGYTFFYSTWSHSWLSDALSDAGLPSRLLILGVSGVLILLSTPFLAALSACLWENARQELNRMDGSGKVGLGKAFCLLTAVYLLAMAAILRANFYYIDDFGRAAFGYKEWPFFSRYLSSAISTYLHGDNYLTDVSPLPQLVSAGILGLSGVLVLACVYDRKAFSLWELASVIPLGLNPYFLECLSYKYDSPYMALSILGAVFPLLFRGQAFMVYLFASVAGTLTVCTTYQAASGIYPMLVVVIALGMWQKKGTLREAALFCGKSTLSYGMGLVLFQQLILRPEKTYAGTIASPGALLPTVVGNYQKFYSLVLSDLKPLWLLLIAALAAAFWVRLFLTPGSKRLISAAAATAGLLFMFLLCFGVYPALADASFDPRAMYGFGAMVALISVCAAEGRPFVPVKLISAVLSWTFFVFSFTYGNALSVQKAYTDFRVETVLEDLNEMEAFQSGNMIRLEFTGSIGKSPVLRNMPQNYGILNRLVPETFCGGWMWGEYGIRNYYNLKNADWIEGTVTDPETLTLYADRMYYTILYNEECVQVVLK